MIVLRTNGTSFVLPYVGNAPDFSSFTEPTLSILQKAWQDFINSGQELEVVPDPEPETDPPNLIDLRDEICYGKKYPLIQHWYDNLPPRHRDPLQLAIANQDLSSIQSALMPIMPDDEPTLAEFVSLFTEFKISFSTN